MKKEIKRKIIGDKVLITYTDGSNKSIFLRHSLPKNLDLDGEYDESIVKGHIFKND